MIECVLRQQAAPPVGVGKLKVRETLKAERVLFQTPLCVCFKGCTAVSQSNNTGGLFDSLTSSDTFIIISGLWFFS